jgi:hypothetical protein
MSIYWKQVIYKGEPIEYFANNIGEIKDMNGNFLTQYTTASYNTVRIRQKNVLAHRIIAETFIPNPDNKRCVNHIDSNRRNNKVENLEWVTHKENSEHASKKGRFPRGEKSYLSKLNAINIEEIRRSNLKNVELAKIYNVTKVTIGNIINRETWKHI